MTIAAMMIAAIANIIPAINREMLIVPTSRICKLPRSFCEASVTWMMIL